MATQYQEIVRAADGRSHDLRNRLVSAVLIAGLTHVLLGWWPAWLWALGYAGLQITEQAVSAWYRKGGPEQARARQGWVFAAQFAAGTAYASLGVGLWSIGDPAGVASGVILWCLALLNTIVVSQGSRGSFFAGSAPHVACLLGQPLLALSMDLPVQEALLLTLAAAVLCFSVASTWGVYARRLASEARAHAEAERRRVEAEAAVAARSAFVAAVCHELRTPISGVLASATELQRGAEDPRQAECAAIVADSARFMGTLLNDLLDLAKIEAGRMTVEPVAFDLGLFAHDVSRFWAVEAGARRLPLRMDAALGLPAQVSGDPTRLRQIMNNLLSNALKFTGPEGVVWSLDAAPLAGERWALQVRVRDTGPGVPPDKLDRLFSAFEQADVSIARTHGGTGLGLAISRELARLMGGDLTVASEVGEGAVFTLTVVLDAAAAGEGAAATSAPASLGAGGRLLRILAADDHEINRRTLALLLEPLGAQVTYAVNGQDALVRAKAQAFDLILMDVLMPTLGGIEAVRRLRAEPGPNRLTPVVAVTGADSAEQLEGCRAAGMNGCVAKPLSAEPLYEAIYAALGESAAAPLALSA